MHQKFSDVRHWLDSPDKKLLHFFCFKKTFLQQLCVLTYGEITCSTPQSRLIWVCLQQPSWTFDTHLRRSQTGYPSVVYSLLGPGRSRRKRGLANTMGAAAAAPRCHWGSQPLLRLCAHWKARESRLWASLAPDFEDLRETVLHVPVRSDCPSVLKRNSGDMARFSEETGNHFLLCAAWSFYFSGVGTRPETARPLTASNFPIISIDVSFVANWGG